MPDQPEAACLVLADISGYTSYLAGVELDHAQDILADLTDVVVRSLRPMFWPARPASAKDRAKLEQIGPMLSAGYVSGLAGLRSLLEADLATRAAAAAADGPEPELPVSAGRNLSEPQPGH